MEQRLAEAEKWLETIKIDLLVTGVEATDGDTLDLISRFVRCASITSSTLVIVRRREPRFLATLKSIPVGGVFDASSDAPENFLAALNAIASGCRYWSPNLQRPCSVASLANRIIDSLTPTERLILALIGDGSDDASASEKLGMKPASIQAIRRSLHRKLRVRQKSELVNAAVQYGFVRFIASGATPIGLGILLADYQARSQRPVTLSAKLAGKFLGAAGVAAENRRRAHLS